MNGKFAYFNTDLDLVSAMDLTEIVDALKVRDVRALHVVPWGNDGGWHAMFETTRQFTEPELNIAAMLDVVELFSPPVRAAWDGCTLREFNIGYGCGDEPWAFNYGLSAMLLTRIAAAGASLRMTLYPDRAE
jgi:hypothetical protein